jgi:Bacterial PH domain
MKLARSTVVSNGHEHEFEAEHGLPEPLPQGEKMLWQGSPDWRAMALQVFHVRKIAIYFGVILLLRVSGVLADGGTLQAAAIAGLWLVPLIALALGLLAGLAWLSARTTVYTLTDRRVIMRIGIVLSLTFNLPYRSLGAADVKALKSGIGDISIRLAGKEKIAFFHLWPHARPWQLATPQPSLRCIQNVDRVAQIFATAWASATGATIAPRPAAAKTSTAQSMPASGLLTS